MNTRVRNFLLVSVIFSLVGCTTFNSSTDSAERLQKPPQVESSTLISPQLLKEELALIKAKVLSIHPQPFARVSSNEFESAFEQVNLSLNFPLSPREFYFRIAPLLAKLRDVHSFVSLPKDLLNQSSKEKSTLFPLAVVIENNKVYVAADLSDKPLIPHGAEITSINQASIEHLLNIMRSVTAKETSTGQNRRIQLDFSWLLSAMGYSQNQFQIEYLWRGIPTRQLIQGLQIIPPATSQETVSYYGYSKLTDATALLWLNDFEEQPEVFDRFLQEKFAQMAGTNIQNLIIDVRYNQGGLSENLKNLLSKMTDKPIYWANQGVIKISKQLKSNHVRLTRVRREDKYKWGLQWVPLEWTNKLQHSIYWSNPGDIISLQLDAIQPEKNYRPPQIWVLTNGFCYSACSLFVASVNHYHLATTVGEQIGSFAQHQFAYPIQILLPHSNMTITLPTMRFDFELGTEAELSFPLEAIERTAEDISERADPVLNHALREAEGINRHQ